MKLMKSFAELAALIPKEELEIEKPKKEKIKKEKEIYEANNIRIKGTQLATTDGCYETYSNGVYTSWRITMLGQKSGSVDIGTNIEDGYPHGSFHDRSRAATILVEMVNRYKK